MPDIEAINEARSEIRGYLKASRLLIVVTETDADVVRTFAMILTFGVEKSLKALRRHIDGVEPSHGHNLIDLFEDLDEKTRDWVGVLSGVKPRHFQAAFADNQDGFTEWRYAEERDEDDGELVLFMPSVFIGVMEAALLFLRREVEGLRSDPDPG